MMTNDAGRNSVEEEQELSRKANANVDVSNLRGKVNANVDVMCFIDLCDVLASSETHFW